MLDKELAIRLIQGKPWHHNFEIIPGVRTSTGYDPERLWHDLMLPEDMRNISLADVGASNGYFSFQAAKRGARVVAFDFRHKDNSGFGLAQHINKLDEIEHHNVNVFDISADKFGTFDIVLALGLLYHVADPYRVLANCAALCRDRLLVESYCIDYMLKERKLVELPIMLFLPDTERFPNQGQPNRDRSNFWGFTSVCLQKMIEDIGFSVNRVKKSADRVLIDAKRAVDQAQTRLHIAYGIIPRVPMSGDPNDPQSWTIF